MNFEFNDWYLTAPGFLAHQYDNETRQIAVEGGTPDGWTWTMLVRCGKYKDAIALEKVGNELRAMLTANNLSIGNAFYDFQLRGEQGEKTMHTNVATAYISAAISGDGEWPLTPTEFLQFEARLRDINAHPPIPGEDGAHWALWDYAQQEYLLSEFPLPEGTAGFNIHSLPAEDELVDADEMPFYDESAQGQRKTTWQNIKAKLKAYFDDLFVAKEEGKGLTSNDYTDEDKRKVADALTEHQSLEDYQPKSKHASIVLRADAWCDMMQTVQVEGVSADMDSQIIDVYPAIAGYSNYVSMAVMCINQGENSLEFSCALVPNVDIPVEIKITEV